MEHHEEIAKTLVSTTLPRFIIIMLKLPYGYYDNIPIDDLNVQNDSRYIRDNKWQCLGQLDVFKNYDDETVRHLCYELFSENPIFTTIYTHIYIKNNTLAVGFSFDGALPDTWQGTWELDTLWHSAVEEDFCETYEMASSISPNNKNTDPDITIYTPQT